MEFSYFPSQNCPLCRSLHSGDSRNDDWLESAGLTLLGKKAETGMIPNRKKKSKTNLSKDGQCYVDIYVNVGKGLRAGTQPEVIH